MEIQTKDQQFKSLYTEYSGKIYRLCLGYIGDAMAADDLMQEVFIKAWQNFEKFRGEASLSTWIYRIAINACLHHIRSNKNKKAVPVEHLPDIHSSDESTEKENQLQLLYKCIGQLKESDRLLITMTLEQIPYSEIAQVTGISEGNLRVKIHRIREQLSILFKKYDRL